MRRKAELIVTGKGFTVLAKSQADYISFEQINAVAVYKRDLITIDLICCDIFIVSEGKELFWTVHEELPGFNELMVELKNLPGFRQDWFQVVVQPAFAENRTVVFERSANVE